MNLPGYDAWKLASGPEGADHRDTCPCEDCEAARAADRAELPRCYGCDDRLHDVDERGATSCACLDPVASDQDWISDVLPCPPGPAVFLFEDKGRAPKLQGFLAPVQAATIAAALSVDPCGVTGGTLRAPWEGHRPGAVVGLALVGGVRWWAVLEERRIAAPQQDPAASPPPNCTNDQVVAGNSAGARANAQACPGDRSCTNHSHIPQTGRAS